MNDGVLPLAEETDMLVILGGPMNPDDEMPWIQSERRLILVLMAQKNPFMVLALVHNRFRKH